MVLKLVIKWFLVLYEYTLNLKKKQNLQFYEINFY